MIPRRPCYNRLFGVDNSKKTVSQAPKCAFLKQNHFFSTLNGKYRFRDMAKNKNLHSAGRPKPLDSNADRIFCVTLRVLKNHDFCNVAVIVKNISSLPKLVATAALFELVEFHLLRLEWIFFIGRTRLSGLSGY